MLGQLRSNPPCWYQLSWHKRPAGIKIRIHQNFLDRLDLKASESTPFVRHFLEVFGLKSFSGEFNKDWGFEGSFLRLKSEDGFSCFLAMIPKVKRLLDDPCERCAGKKRDEFGKCLECAGTGKKAAYDWHKAYAVSASFTVLTNLINFPNEPTDGPVPQLMLVATLTQQGMHGGALGGEYGKQVVDWLRSLPVRSSIPEMVSAMKSAYNRMWGVHEYDIYSFRTDMAYPNGWLNVSIPGDACGLNPNNLHGSEDASGYDFSCHNVDSPIQQITLLTGLAALHDLVLKDL